MNGVLPLGASGWSALAEIAKASHATRPLHVIMLVNAGIILGEMWDMDDLAEDCAADGVYDFMLVAPPLTFTGSVGSPVNPQVIK